MGQLFTLAARYTAACLKDHLLSVDRNSTLKPDQAAILAMTFAQRRLTAPAARHNSRRGSPCFHRLFRDRLRADFLVSRRSVCHR